MFYTDELRRYTPLAYLALMCVTFWAVMFFAWPFWTGAFFAIAYGILGSYLFGAWLRERLRRKITWHDTQTRKAIQEQLDQEGRDHASRRP
jgi:hypothetical protein